MKGKRLFLLSVAALTCLSLASCGGKNKNKYSNKETPLIFSTQEVDGVFNPFFSTSGTDSNVVGLTQIGMLGNDSKGNVVYGEDEAVVVLDMDTTTQGSGEDQTTTYNFVLKNNVKFSNGSPLTMKDVLFNLYVYLDPVYSGSSTIYSTDIVGLKEYRTQESSENEQDAFKKQFEIKARTRIDALIDASNVIFEEDPYISMASYESKLASMVNSSVYPHIVTDFNKVKELFKEELNTDYSNSVDSYEDIKFFKEDGTQSSHKLSSDVEAFLYNEGYIQYDKKTDELTYSLGEASKNYTKEQAIDTIFNAKLPVDVEEIVSYWATATNLFDFLTNQAMEEHFANTDREYKNISGIKFANRSDSVTVNGKSYAAPTYNDDGSVKTGNEVLSITIHKIDPKAIWNFAFTVAPMYYYSDSEHIAEFDYVSNFGVEYSSQTFMNTVVKDPNKIGVPVGAGPYQAAKSTGGTDGVTAGTFREKGVIYFEANPNYIAGEPLIKKIRYQVVAQNRMKDALYNGEIDFIEPNAKPELIAELNSKKKDGIGNKSIQTSGYGYIGINAGKVPDIEVRQAIMHSINTAECVSYYKNTAEAIYRPMSKASWAYPEGCTPYYPALGAAVPSDLSSVNPFYKEFIEDNSLAAGTTMDEATQIEFITSLVEEAGYTKNAKGIYQKGTNQLKYTFTIAGEETDHPAWQAMYHASEILNKCGFQIIVTTDPNALSKLSTGALTVWAAAWGSTIDPDMYQVYHKDSSATSVLNWGYKQILANNGGKYDTELELVEKLSELIDKGRETNVQSERKVIYAEALNVVMEMAVELPTYQRDDLFAYNTNKIDVNTLTPDSELSPYKGLTGDIHKVSLVER